MVGTIAPRAMGFIPGSSPGTLSAGHVNSFRVMAVVERLASHFQPGTRSDPGEIYTLCLSLARGIDYAIANNDIPPRAQELPSLLKQVYQRKNEARLQAAVMVLMISLKNACKSRWFSVKDAEELLTLAQELGRSFCSPGDIKIEPSSLPHVISNVMSRFFPRMKLGPVLTSIEVQPGYGAFAVDFHILKEKVPAVQEKIWLFVVQADAILTSACLISPPKVNFLLNGKGVGGRIDIALDTGPQLPTNVTTMLKYGTNLLQAIGQFNGNYIIAVAVMAVTESSDMPALQDHVRPVAAELESDSEIIEGASRISLNCPISFRRIKVPVKGQLCKHHQCFDFENYISINSRRPSWRCPHCNQSVCYMDLRIDQNMAKVLRDVAGTVVDVVVSADGSWKPVMESADRKDEHCDRSPRYDQDGSEQCESAKYSNTLANAVDLTMEDAEENEATGTCTTEDTKPFKDGLPGPAIGVNLSSETSNTPQIHNRIEDDFWSGVFFPSPSTVSPAFNREVVDICGTGQATAPIGQPQTFVPSNLQLHPSQAGNSLITTDFGRAIPRYVERNPIAVQALPAPSQMPASHNRLRTNVIPLMASASPFASQTSVVPPLTDASQNWDHQGHPYGPNGLQPLVGIPTTSSVSSSYRNISGLPSERNNHHQQQHHQLPLNVGIPHAVGQPPAAQTYFRHGQVQQGGAQSQEAGATNSHTRTVALNHRSAAHVARSPPAVPVQLQAPRTGTSFPMTADRVTIRTEMDQRATNMGIVSRTDMLNELPSEQNWRPTGRMRGSLSGRAYSAALSQLVIQPTHSAQPPTPTPDLSSAPAGVAQLQAQQLQAMIASNINPQGSLQHTYPRTGDTAGNLGGTLH